MRIFKNKWFAKFARKNGISDAALKLAVAEIEAGNVDADLGGCVYKQRVARQGRGKRGGYRTIVLLRQGERAFFVSGYAKKDLGNIADDDLLDYKEIAKGYMSASGRQLDGWVDDGSLIEIT
jgi:hypothetical protein